MLRWLLLFFGSFLMTDGDPRIIGGSSVAPGEFPNVVHLKIHRAHCTGSIIDERWVLTAAHCFMDVPKGSTPEVKVFAGGVDFSNPTPQSKTINSVRVILHPGYQGSDDTKVVHDIALVELNEPLNFSGCCINKVRLVGGKFPGVKTYPCTAVGFGITKPTVNNKNTKLWKLSVEASVLVECFKRSYYVYEILGIRPHNYREPTGQMICMTAPTDKDTCLGDSGGPLMCSGVQAGVLSHGASKKTLRPRKVRCALSDYVNVYFFTGAYIGWIRQYVKTLGDPEVLSLAVNYLTSPLYLIIAVSLVHLTL